MLTLTLPTKPALSIEWADDDPIAIQVLMMQFDIRDCYEFYSQWAPVDWMHACYN